MTEFTIMDVGHGSCCYLIASNTNLMLFDCGHKSIPENRPSKTLWSRGQNSVEVLIITNYDEDHISDLVELHDQLHIQTLVRNLSIDAEQLRKLKIEQSGELSSAMRTLLRMMGEYVDTVSLQPTTFPDVHRTHYYNEYPFGIGDTNNISVVTILKVKDTTFLIPGDIEREGWKQLLSENSGLRESLVGVDYFIASHHGRENGYYDDLFARYNCRPKAFIFSDSQKKYATQEMNDKYRYWAKGVTYNGQTRYVLTTRKDGSLTWIWRD